MSRKHGLALALFALVACDKKEAPPVDTTEKPSTAATPPAPPAPAPVAAATPPEVDSLSVEEEFEAVAENVAYHDADGERTKLGAGMPLVASWRALAAARCLVSFYLIRL